MNADRPLAQPGVLEDLLQRLDAGEPAIEVAKRYGVSDVALYRYLLRNAPEEWKAISAGQALARVDSEDRKLDSAQNGVELGRARERLSLAKWTLERTARSIYGDSQQLSVSAEQLGDLLMQISSRMLTERQVSSVPAERVIDATNA